MWTKLICIAIVGGQVIAGCQDGKTKATADSKTVGINQQLREELKAMAEIDQIAAYIPEGRYKEWTLDRWNEFKDSVFRANTARVKQIFDQFGYPGYDLVGEEGEMNFWVMVQHSDFDPDFQQQVLVKLENEVKKHNADGRNFGLLTDRVRLNKGGQQIYGTQVSYNAFGQAFPRNLMDSVNVNRRRKEVGLVPLEEYLNRMTQMHFEMNKEFFKRKGITEPRLYKE